MRALAAGAVVAATVGLAAVVPAVGAPATARAVTSATPATLTPSLTPAATPDPTRAVVTLRTVTPAVVAPGDTVTVAGTVTAPSSGPLTGATVRVVLDRQRLDERAQVATWAASTDPSDGRTVGTVDIADIPASGRTTFTLTTDAGAVRSDRVFAALPVSVEVVQEGASTPVGVTHSFLSWHVRKEYDRLQVATAVPLTLDPDVDLYSGDPTTRDAAWTEVIGPTSRVQRIVDGTKGAQATLAVDPSLFGPETPPAIGTPSGSPSSTSTTPTPSTSAPSTPPPSGATSPPASAPTSGTGTATSTATSTATDGADGDGARSRTEAALTSALVGSLRGRELWALPYADADMAATVDSDDTNGLVRDLVDRARIVSDTVGQPVRDDVVWPVDGLLPPGREAALRTLLSGTAVGRAAGVVVDERAVTSASTPTPSARRVASGGTRLLAYDPVLSSLLPTRADAGSALPVQRYLAETLVLLGERPGTTRSVFVTAPRNYDPDPATLSAFLAAVSSAPWVDPVDPAALLEDSGGDQASAAETPVQPVTSAAPKPTLSAGRLANLAAQRSRLQDVAAVLADGQAFERTYREVLDELASARWRWQPDSWNVLSNTVARETTAATSAITVADQSVNFLAEQGSLQVTVENGLPFAVAGVRLVLAPTNPRMQVVEQPGAITVAPGSKRTVRVPVVAVAAGRADIRAYLTTEDGTPIGSPAVISVSANPLDGRIYWVGGAVVALVLVAGVGRALLRGTSRIDEIADEAGPTPPAGPARR
ncbi:DUF6049 family protein [Terracoccus luteus]|uniref:Uncharacterized protein n=1 Tax=Terracoccus luteus TaxID=53356 RepID=A0A839PUP9_9MICO|nr:DUF6049 family protein [Terracoccus luteus]MBB2987247.1 hypothetical protein [Terracoccus luteus]MCP2172898.1 hypothetical protein [Terracoccus luteus]